MNAQSLAVSFNTRIHNKPPAWREEYADNWRSTETDLADLQEAIRQGHAFIAADMRSPHRSNTAFRHADLAVVDIDHGLDLEHFHEHVLARSACLLYTSSSHDPTPGKHRFRVLFRLPRRIDDPDLYRAVVTALIHALGGDQNCKDPCRIFYGNSRAEFWLNPQETALSEAFVEEARKAWLRQQARHAERSDDYDDVSIGQAIHVLEEVLPATADGERDLFVRITAAAASAGDALFEAWSDWASRGHHGTGKNRKQTTERFFRGFSGNSSLGTLFYLASEHDPHWRDSLPDALRSSGYGDSKMPPGYRIEDLMGYNDPEFDLPKPGRLRTPSIIEWAAQQQAQEPEAAQAAPAATEEPAQPRTAAEEFMAAMEAELYGDPYEYAGPVSESPLPPEPKRRGRKPQAGKGGSSEVVLIREKVKALYPELRYNRLTQDIEIGPKSTPVVFEDADKAYLLISEGEDKTFAKTHVYDTILLLARQQSYNPVHEFLDEAAKHEPVDYFDTIATTLLGVPEEGPRNPRLPCGDLLADAVIKRFLIASIARAFDPGCPMGWMPILSGPQNVGKSFFLEYLTPPRPLTNTYPWCPTIQQGIAYLKERPHALHAGWIVKLDEVDRFFRRQYTEEFKNLVTVAVDRSRRLYENERMYPRSFVLAGCTNHAEFMVDPTGNRRFLAIYVNGKVPAREDSSIKIVDLDRVKADRMRIWSAAYRAYKDTPNHEFSSYEIKHIEEYLNGFRVDSPLTGALEEALSRNSSGIYQGRPYYIMSDIFRWLEMPLNPNQAGNNGVADELKRLGYYCSQVRIAGKPRRVWVSSAPPALDLGLGLASDWRSNVA